jgi:hypothetical protein
MCKAEPASMLLERIREEWFWPFELGNEKHEARERTAKDCSESQGLRFDALSRGPVDGELPQFLHGICEALTSRSQQSRGNDRDALRNPSSLCKVLRPSAFD